MKMVLVEIERSYQELSYQEEGVFVRAVDLMR